MTGRRPLLLLTLALVLAGCPEQEDTGQVILRFYAPPDFSPSARRSEVVDCWNSRNGDELWVEYQELSPEADDQHATLLSMLQAEDSEADVVGLDVTWTQEFAKDGLILPLDEIAGSTSSEEDVNPERLFRQSWETLRFDDRSWGVPLHINVGLLYYNTGVVAREDVPQTWDELEQLLRETDRPEGMAGYVGQLEEYEGLTVNAAELVWGHGGAFIEGRGTVTAGQQDAVSGVGFLARGLRDEWISLESLGYTEQSSLQAFRRGDAMFLRHWPYAYTHFAAEDSEVKDDFGVAPLPGPNAVGGVNLAVSAFSEHPEEAYRFIQFLTSDEVQRNIFRDGGYPPAVRSVYEAGSLEEPAHIQGCPELGGQAAAPSTLGEDAELLNALNQSFEKTRSRPASPYYPRITQLIQRTVSEMLNRPQPADDRELERQLQSGLNDLAGDLRSATRGR